MKNKKLSLVAALVVASLVAVAPIAKADTVLAVQTAQKVGTTVTAINSGLVAAAAYQIRNDGNTFIEFTKTGAGSSTVAVTVQATLGGLSVSAMNITVPATTGRVLAGPFPPSIFNDANGDMHFTISDSVGLNLAIFKL